MLFLCLDYAIHSKVGLEGWEEVGKHSFHSYSTAPFGVFCFYVLLFHCHDCLEMRKSSKYFDLTFSYTETVINAFDDRRWWFFFFNNFAPFSKSQIITSRVGGFFFFFFSNGCKSPAHVIKDADINILVCKLIPSAQL